MVDFQLAVLLSTLSEENIRKVPFFRVFTNGEFFCRGEGCKCFCVHFLCHILQEDLMLSGNSNCLSDVYLSVESSIPL